MKPIDKHYLSLQFQNKILLKDGTEFQSFFEDIMEKAFLDFQKIRPYGNQGDGGNDGYRETLGIYYQVYAPMVPKVNEKEAAEKFEADFQKLKNNWNGIANIKEYNFVFNDKYYGSVQLLEEIRTKLQISNPSIGFKLLLAKDLEDVFFQLSESDKLRLGFNINQRQAVSNTYAFLDNVKVEFDRENVPSAQKLLGNIKDIVLELGDEDLSLEYEILECMCIQKSENFDEAREKYESIAKRYPQDPRPFLYLAEICLSSDDLEANYKFLEKAKAIDDSFWLLRLQYILRQQYLGEKIEFSSIDEKTFPDDKKRKAAFYRLYGLLLENSGDHINADSFIAKAIYLNPVRFNSYLDQLSLVERRMFESQDDVQREQLSQALLDSISRVENQFAAYGDIGPRNKLYLCTKKFSALLVQENKYGIENLAGDIFHLAMNCYFDKRIENILVSVFRLISLPDDELSQLLKYLKKSKRAISDDLAEVLIHQFILSKNLYTTGKAFFIEIGNQKYFDFIHDLESENHEQVLSFLSNRIPFMLSLAHTLDQLSLRKKIIESLPNDENFQKNKIELLLKFDEQDFDESFRLLKQLDLTNLNYFDSLPILQIVRHKKAWDFEIVILEKLIAKERNEKELFNLKWLLSLAYLNLKNFPEAIEIGKQLLEKDLSNKYLDSRMKEALLNNTLFACLERGKVDTDAFQDARILLQNYFLENPSYEFKVGIEAEVYLRNNEPEKALESVISGVQNKKTLSPKDYAELYIRFIEIGNMINLNLDSLNSVQKNSFVKLVNKDSWYFMGNENALDALPISETNNKYSILIGKNLGSKITFEKTYSSEAYEDEIEIILNTQQYIIWQVYRNFQKLAENGDLEWVQPIKILRDDETVDLSNFVRYFEDNNSRTEPFFDLYCKNNYPLAVLAISEGGLPNALSRIQSVGNGFVNFSSGLKEDLEN